MAVNMLVADGGVPIVDGLIVSYLDDDILVELSLYHDVDALQRALYLRLCRNVGMGASWSATCDYVAIWRTLLRHKSSLGQCHVVVGELLGGHEGRKGHDSGLLSMVVALIKDKVLLRGVQKDGLWSVDLVGAMLTASNPSLLREVWYLLPVSSSHHYMSRIVALLFVDMMHLATTRLSTLDSTTVNDRVRAQQTLWDLVIETLDRGDRVHTIYSLGRTQFIGRDSVYYMDSQTAYNRLLRLYTRDRVRALETFATSAPDRMALFMRMLNAMGNPILSGIGGNDLPIHMIYCITQADLVYRALTAHVSSIESRPPYSAYDVIDVIYDSANAHCVYTVPTLPDDYAITMTYLLMRAYIKRVRTTAEAESFMEYVSCSGHNSSEHLNVCHAAFMGTLSDATLTTLMAVHNYDYVTAITCARFYGLWARTGTLPTQLLPYYYSTKYYYEPEYRSYDLLVAASYSEATCRHLMGLHMSRPARTHMLTLVIESIEEQERAGRLWEPSNAIHYLITHYNNTAIMASSLVDPYERICELIESDVWTTAPSNEAIDLIMAVIGGEGGLESARPPTIPRATSRTIQWTELW